MFTVLTRRNRMMNMNQIINQIEKVGILPVIKIDRLDDALPLAQALIDGGISAAEITFRTHHAKDAIQLIKNHFPKMLVGAGTVLTPNQVDDALEAGAQFIVAPGTNPTVIEYCKKRGILIIPGVQTASEIETVMDLGLRHVKFFPAEVNGGLKAIQALAAPYPEIRFLPTGGISLDNMLEYLKSKKVIACGGSWMVHERFIKEKNYEEITKQSREAVLKMLDLTIQSITLQSNTLVDDPLFDVLNPTLNLDKHHSVITIKTPNINRVKHMLDLQKRAYQEDKGLILSITESMTIEINE